MLAAFRRLRLVGLLAICLSPGSAGILVPALVPCTTMAMAPAAMNGPMAGHEAGTRPAGDDQQMPQHGLPCHCVVTCCAGAPALAGRITTSEPAPLSPRAVPNALLRTASVARSRPADRLPPTTAPPLSV